MTLLTLCACVGSTLASYVGYGNVAGFLFNKGIMSAPPPAGHGPPGTTADGTPINPITGVAQRQDDSGPEMTEEEKEREAEKLFVLFDRLEKSGAGSDKERLRETQSINKSLSALGDVIAALGEKGEGKGDKHIPYRNSKVRACMLFLWGWVDSVADGDFHSSRICSKTR